MKIEDKKELEIELKDITFGTCIFVDKQYYIVTDVSSDDLPNMGSNERLAINLETGISQFFTSNLTPKIIQAKVVIK